MSTSFDTATHQDSIGQNSRSITTPQSSISAAQSGDSLSYFYYGILCVVFSALFVIGFAGIYTGSERYVYFWDYAQYWKYFQHLGSLICSDIWNALTTVGRSIRQSDYNFLAVLPIAPVACIFGGSRVAYIVSIATFFILPAAFLGARIMVLLWPEQPAKMKALLFSAAAFSFLVLHPIWIPVLEGRPDVLGLTLVFGIIAIFLKRPLALRSLPVLAGIGFLLVCLFFVRRWYAYWVVAFFPAALIADILRDPARDFLMRLRGSVRALAVIGIVFSIAVWSIATPLMRRIFSTDYSDAYSAYKTSASGMNVLLKVIDYFGAPMLVIATIGLLFGVARASSRYFAVFLIIQSIIISVLFFGVQDFGPQHYLLLVPIIFYGTASIIGSPFASKMRKGLRVSGAILAFGLIVLSSVAVFSQSVNAKVSRNASILTPNVTRFPKVRNDLDRLGKLTSQLNILYKEDPGEIYTIASSLVINDNILRNYCDETLPNRRTCKAIVGTGNVDKRDGFPRGFLHSKYVVLATPTQYHLRPQDQRVVGILAREFETSAGVARSFKRVGTSVVLKGNVELSIFKKVEPIPHDAVAALSEEFLRIYPENKKLFSVSP